MNWAISDVHGCLDALKTLMTKIRAEDTNAEFLFLGDYIDRGPDSAGVVDIVMNESSIALMGNHEVLCLNAHCDHREQHLWLVNGGHSCLQSFGTPIPDKYLTWMANLPKYIETVGYYLVHAGFYPGCEPCDQKDINMLWIREDFIDSDYTWDKPVIHGHTPVKFVDCDGDRRIAIDTGAVYGKHGYGHLSAFCLDDRRIISVVVE